MFQDASMTAPQLRLRAGERLKQLTGGESFGFSVRAAEGRLYYGQGFGTGHLSQPANAFEGHQLLGGAIHEPQSGGWSLYRPLRSHSNRFARLEEDHDVETVLQKEAHRNFYQPNGIRDQLRCLLYDVDGSFLGLLAAARPEHSFDDESQATANRAMSAIVDDFRLAWSMEQADCLDSSAHLVVDEYGHVRFGGKAATTWLTEQRCDEIKRRVGRLSRFLIDDVLFCGCRLEPIGDWYLSMTPVRGTKRSLLSTLSATQRAILDLAQRGMTNDEIGHALAISASTVKYHLRALYDALDLESRTELASVTIREHPVAHSHADGSGDA